MKYIIVIVALLFVIGCSTPPWSEREIRQMRNDDINCVPIIQTKF